MKATQTANGFKIGDDKGCLIDVQYACSSTEGERKRWAAIRVFCANGDVVDIDASPRVTHVERKWKQHRKMPDIGGSNG